MSYLVLTLGDFVLGDIIIGDFVLWDFVQKCFCPRGLCPKGFCHGGFGPKPIFKALILSTFESFRTTLYSYARKPMESESI